MKLDENSVDNQSVQSSVTNFNHALPLPTKVDDYQASTSNELGGAVQHPGDHCSSTCETNESINTSVDGQSCANALPDHLKEGLDIVGINPSIASAHLGHHYAGPGNHFWTCLTEAGLVPTEVTCYDDMNMLDYGIGFTNVCTRATKGAAELTRKEMKAGSAVMLDKIRKYKPKIAVFNGKGIYEAFIGHKNFSMGKQPQPLSGTDTVVFVMPSSSARCAQLPRAEDKLPFFIALRKLRDYLRGERSELADSEPDPKSLRKAERRRKRKAEAAAAAAAAMATGDASAQLAVSGANCSGLLLKTDLNHASGTEACLTGSPSSKRKKPTSQAADITAVQQNPCEVPATVINTGTNLTLDLQAFQQQQQAFFAMQGHQQQNPFSAAATAVHHHPQFQHPAHQQVIVSGGQIMATPMVSISMPGLNGTTATMPIGAGAQSFNPMAASCYAPMAATQFQLPAGHQFIVGQSSQQPQLAATGQQTATPTLLSWPQSGMGTHAQLQPGATWQALSNPLVPVTAPTAVYQQQQHHQVTAANTVHAAAGAGPVCQATVMVQPTQPPPQQNPSQPTQQTHTAQAANQQAMAAAAAAAQHQQLLFAPPGQPTLGPSGATSAYPQHVYFAPATGTGAGGAASYHLLPVGCPQSGFASVFVSDQTQQQAQHQPTQQQQQQQTNPQQAQTQSQQPQQVAIAQPPHYATQQAAFQTQHQAHQPPAAQHPQIQLTPQGQPTASAAAAAAAAAFLHPNQLTQQAVMTGDPCAAGPQFITLATGQPLKVMALGPGGQLIQTTGLHQFMSAAPMGMTMTAQHPAVAIQTAPNPQQQQQQKTIQQQPPSQLQRRTPGNQIQQQQQQQQMTSGSQQPTAFFTSVSQNASTATGIPLVQTASGGDELAQATTVGGVAGTATDEKLVYTAL
nr:unnamed protein product [Spirometra erinaceieuropaei]